MELPMVGILKEISMIFGHGIMSGAKKNITHILNGKLLMERKEVSHSS
jgi:hypothetical protein